MSGRIVPIVLDVRKLPAVVELAEAAEEMLRHVYDPDDRARVEAALAVLADEDDL